MQTLTTPNISRASRTAVAVMALLVDWAWVRFHAGQCDVRCPRSSSSNMNRTLNKNTKNAVNERQKQDFCNDCERYKAFCDGRKIWYNEDDYWCCEQCIKDGRPEQEETNEQQSILQFIGGDSR